jgi:shikimate dehydrogenase
VPLSGHTTVAGIIGQPVEHSRSPAIHNAAYAALGLDWVYVAFPVAVGAVAAALHGFAALGVAGVNVTMPHKAAAAEHSDELAPTAATIGVVNTVLVRDGRLVGDSTDGVGFLDAAREAEIELRGASIVVLGSGGVARALVHALGPIAAQLVVAARRVDAAAAVARLAPAATAVGLDQASDAVAAAAVVVNATPIGMRGEAPPFDVAGLDASHIVIDTVYAPPETPLLAAARARGAQAVNGLGMLVHQAARSFTLLTGRDAPVEVMWAAARAAE